MKNEILENVIIEHKASNKEQLWVFEYDSERLEMESRKTSWKTKGQAMSALISSIKTKMYKSNLPDRWSLYAKIKPTILEMLKEGRLVLRNLE